MTDLRTILRIAMYINVVLIFVAPAPLVPLVVVSQVGIIVALAVLRRRRRPREPHDRDEAIHPR